MPFPAVPAPTLEIIEHWQRQDYVAHVASWSAIRYHREKTGLDPIPEFDAALVRHWPDGERKRVTWPLHLRVHRA